MFAHTLRNIIKELYGLQGSATNAIDTIAINHVVSGLSEEIISQAKVLKLTGNKTLECLLELVEDKLSGNMLFVNSSTVRDKNNASKGESDRITKLEQMFEMLLNPIEDGGQKGPPTSFPPVTSTNVRISPQNFLTFSLNPFATLV